MTRRIINELPFEHYGPNGTHFTSPRCDFVGGLKAVVPTHCDADHFAADCLSLGWFHAMNITPDLNGFTGPKTINVVHDV